MTWEYKRHQTPERDANCRFVNVLISSFQNISTVNFCRGDNIIRVNNFISHSIKTLDLNLLIHIYMYIYVHIYIRIPESSKGVKKIVPP